MSVLLGVCFLLIGITEMLKILMAENSFFYNHPLLLKYEWYWRVEPEITYFCDIT